MEKSICDIGNFMCDIKLLFRNKVTLSHEYKRLSQVKVCLSTNLLEAIYLSNIEPNL